MSGGIKMLLLIVFRSWLFLWTLHFKFFRSCLSDDVAVIDLACKVAASRDVHYEVTDGQLHESRPKFRGETNLTGELEAKICRKRKVTGRNILSRRKFLLLPRAFGVRNYLSRLYNIVTCTTTVWWCD
jgi:hypothetical protein